MLIVIFLREILLVQYTHAVVDLECVHSNSPHSPASLSLPTPSTYFCHLLTFFSPSLSLFNLLSPVHVASICWITYQQPGAPLDWLSVVQVATAALRS